VAQVKQNKSQHHTCKIQNQIVNIEPPQEGEQLHRFYQENNPGAKGNKPKEISQFSPNPWQQPPGRNEQQNIAAQIYKTVDTHISVSGIPQYVQVILGGVKGDKIGILF